ncbi:MAG: hypothetical protein ACF8LK_09070 [Phycisphaerales bacterium JB041]
MHCRQGGDELYIAALQPDGSTLIERWTFDHGRGNKRFGLSGPTPPIGVPQPKYADAASLTLIGPTFNPSTDIVAPRRKRVFEGSSIGIVRDMVVEPQGRFLLLLRHQPREIYFIDLTTTPTGAPVLVTSEFVVPELAQANAITYWEHAADGRMYAANSAKLDASAMAVLFRDADNDAVLDPPEIKSGQELLDYTASAEWEWIWEQ